MAIGNALDYAKFPASVDNAITTLRADDVAQMTAENVRRANLIPPGIPLVIETNAEYAQRVLVTQPVQSWLSQSNELKAAKGDKRVIIDALRNDIPTANQIAAARAALGL